MNRKYFLVIIPLFIYMLVYHTFKTDIDVQFTESKYQLVNSNFFNKTENIISLTGFKNKIEKINIDDNELYFKGFHKKYGINTFYYDFFSDKFYYEKTQFDNETYLKKEKDLDYSEKVLINDLEEKKISILKIDDKKMYKLNNKHGKALLITDNKKVASFNFKTKKIVFFDYYIDYITYKIFLKDYKFSPECEYISIFNLNKKNINLFGADTGKNYGKNLECRGYEWINYKYLILFKNTKIGESTIGVYDLFNSEINYFYFTKNNILNKFFVSNNNITFFEKNGNKGISLIVYNILKKECNNILIDNLNLNELIDATKFKNNVIIGKREDDIDSFKCINTSTNSLYEKKNISRIGDKIYLKVKNGILFKEDNQIKYYDGTNEKKLFETKLIFENILLDNKNNIIIQLRDNNNYILKIIRL